MSTQPTRFALPNDDGGLLVRRRLLARLDRAAVHPVVLIAAPAGYGKTTLLAQWAGGREHVRWFDGHDPQAWHSVEQSLADGVTVIVDDAHEAGWGKPFARAVAAASQNAHLVLASRADPLVALHGLRLSGSVAELRQHDLAFTAHEVRLVARRAGVPVGAAQASDLMTRTDGWPAGIRLSLGALGSPDDVSMFSATGSYLLDQVLGALEPETLAVLMATAVPESFDAHLARELARRPDAASVVSEFAHRVGFVTTEEPGGIFRYHQMMRRVLLNELGRTDPERVEALHAIAGRRSFETGRYEEAAHHAAIAKDWDLAADSAVALTCILLGTWDWGVVDSLTATIPPVYAHRDARMRVVQVWQSMRTGEHQTPATPPPQRRGSVSDDPATRERVTVLECLSRAWVAVDTGRIDEARLLLSAPAPALSDADNRPGSPGGSLRAVWGSIRAFLAVTTGALDEMEDDLGNAERLGQGKIPLVGLAAFEVRLWSALAVGDLAQAAQIIDRWEASSPSPRSPRLQRALSDVDGSGWSETRLSWPCLPRPHRRV